MLDDNFIPNRVKSLRKQKGVSARECSLSIAQSEGYIYKVEIGQLLPTIKALDFLCDYLEITLSQFFDDANDESLSRTQQINRLCQYLRMMEDAELNTMEELLRMIVKQKEGQ